MDASSATQSILLVVFEHFECQASSSDKENNGEHTTSVCMRMGDDGYAISVNGAIGNDDGVVLSNE